jgi:adenylate kinase
LSHQYLGVLRQYLKLCRSSIINIDLMKLCGILFPALIFTLCENLQPCRNPKKTETVHHKKLNIIPNGPPLSCKGAGSTALQAKYGDQMFVIYTGELARARRKQDPEFNRVQGPIMDRGDYLSDEIIIELAEDAYKSACADPKVRFIYWDGVFRTPKQLTHFMDRQIVRLDNTGVFCLRASLGTCLNNMHHRNLRLKRTDDTPETFEHRYQIYTKGIDALLEMYENDGIKVTHIDANRERELVAASVVKYVDEFLIHGKCATRSAEMYVSDVAGRSAKERVLRSAQLRGITPPAAFYGQQGSMALSA